jgi:hypothetical protein
MSAQMKTGVAVLGLVVLAMLGLGWYEYREFRTPKECGFCQRPLQDKLRVVVEIGGQRREACCPQCAVSESRQEHKPVRFISVRDYSTAKMIDPAQAYYVNQSRAMACSHDGMRMDEMKHGEDLAFDRCSPGAFAFAKKEDAEAFIAQNGGQILSMEQLLGEAKPQ